MINFFIFIISTISVASIVIEKEDLSDVVRNYGDYSAYGV